MRAVAQKLCYCDHRLAAARGVRGLQLRGSRGSTSRLAQPQAARKAAMTDQGVLHIDGSILEGGGQILRNSAALSAITQQAIHVDKIRAGRSKPGLAAQHLSGLKLIAAMSGGSLQGGEVRSTEITLSPGALQCGTYTADTQTAGACTLLAQAAVPCLLFACDASTGAQGVTKLELRGGTDAEMAPPIGYLHYVLTPLLTHCLGVDLSIDLVKRGFYPKGGGVVRVQASSLPSGSTLPPINLTDRGLLESVHVHVFCAGRVPVKAAQAALSSARSELRNAAQKQAAVWGVVEGGAAVTGEATQETSATAVGDGAGVTIVARTTTGCIIGASAPSERGKPLEDIASECVTRLSRTLASGACVDEYMADQLIIFMALANGRSRILCEEPSLHTRTAMVIAESLLPGLKFSVSKAQGSQQLYVIECEGAAVAAR